MLTHAPFPQTHAQARNYLPAIAIFLAVVVFSAAFMYLDNAYYRFVSARFPAVGASAWLATLWGLLSRAHLVLLIIPLLLWRPRLFGFQIGRTWQHWRLLLGLLLANCGVIAAYLWLTQSGTPYSGNQWLLTEVVTVPVVEEIFWRGLVFTFLVLVLQKRYAPPASRQMAVWFSGLAFGLLHSGNVLAGVPPAFVAVQVVNAAVWGVAYGYAREQTDSLFPSILLHAAMNLVVILF